MEVEAAKAHRRGHRLYRAGGRRPRHRQHLRQLPRGALRNPSAAPGQFPNLLLGFALAEATGLFGLLVALIILFVF